MYAEIDQLLNTYSYDHFAIAAQQNYKVTNNHVVYEAESIERDLYKRGNSKTKKCDIVFNVYSRNIATAETMAEELEETIIGTRGYINNLFFVTVFQTGEMHDYDHQAKVNIIRLYYTFKIRFSKFLSVDSSEITADSDIVTADGRAIL